MDIMTNTNKNNYVRVLKYDGKYCVSCMGTFDEAVDEAIYDKRRNEFDDVYICIYDNVNDIIYNLLGEILIA